MTLNTPVCGDVTIVVYHARSTFGGKVQGKVIQETSSLFGVPIDRVIRSEDLIVYSG